MKRLPHSLMPFCFAIVVASAFTMGCGGANSGPGTATDQDELMQYLEANPDLKDVPPDESNTDKMDDPSLKNAPREKV